MKLHLEILPGRPRSYRVRLSKNQAVVAVPKFGTYAIGFQNEHRILARNAPRGMRTTAIMAHIGVNAGPELRSKDVDRLRAAIDLLKKTVGPEKSPPTVPFRSIDWISGDPRSKAVTILKRSATQSRKKKSANSRRRRSRTASARKRKLSRR